MLNSLGPTNKQGIDIGGRVTPVSLLRRLERNHTWQPRNEVPARKVGWAQALGIQGKTDGLEGPKETLSWQQLRKCLRESHKLVLQAEGLRLWMQNRLGWPGITLRPPWLVYLDHPLVLILFVAFHVHLIDLSIIR